MDLAAGEAVVHRGGRLSTRWHQAGVRAGTLSTADVEAVGAVEVAGKGVYGLRGAGARRVGVDAGSVELGRGDAVRRVAQLRQSALTGRTRAARLEPLAYRPTDRWDAAAAPSREGSGRGTSVTGMFGR